MRCFVFLWTAVFAFGVLVTPAQAHPHEFIDTAITFRFDDQNKLGAIGVVWVWDDLTSMLIVEDSGIDSDGDGALTPEEKVQLVEIFSQWPADFAGDLYISKNGKPVQLSGPLDMTVDLRDGRVVVHYLRALMDRQSLDDGPVSLQVYDPTYYAFYDLSGTPEVVGRSDCTVEIQKADIAAAQKIYDQLLSQLTDEDIMTEGKYPEVGGVFADEVRLACGAQP